MKKITLGILIILLGVSLYLFPKLYKFNLINIDNRDVVINSILELKGYTSINIVKEKKYNDYYAIIYYRTDLDNVKENLELSIYKKDESLLSTDKYVYYGGASSTKKIDTFNCNDNGKETIIVVYGDNQLTKAYSYSIKNSENIYTKTIESDFILDIYVLYDTDNCTSVNELYDTNGVVIGIF